MLRPLLWELYSSSVHVWGSLSWEEKGMLALCAMGLGGAAYIVLRIWRARTWLRESSVACLGFLEQVLFHMSFVILGPLIWTASRLLPEQVPDAMYLALATLWPMFCSARALVHHHAEKKGWAQEEQETKSSKWWNFRLNLPSLKEDFRMSAKLEEELCFWLCYWSCWPLLTLLQWSLDSLELKGSKGLLIAVALWLQIWQGCFLAPYVFTILTQLFGRCTEYATKILDTVRQLAFRAIQKLPWHVYLVNAFQGETLMILLAGVLLVLICLEVASVVSVLISVVLLFSIATESARCVANEEHRIYADRLAFWVLVNCWLSCLRLPALGSILGLWSPLAFAAAFFGGERAFFVVYFAVLRALTAVVSCLSELLKKESEAGDAKDTGSLFQRLKSHTELCQERFRQV